MKLMVVVEELLGRGRGVIMVERRRRRERVHLLRIMVMIEGMRTVVDFGGGNGEERGAAAFCHELLHLGKTILRLHLLLLLALDFSLYLFPPSRTLSLSLSFSDLISDLP